MCSSCMAAVKKVVNRAARVMATRCRVITILRRSFWCDGKGCLEVKICLHAGRFADKYARLLALSRLQGFLAHRKG